MEIIKESGEREKFNREKLLNSLLRVNLNLQEAEKIVARVRIRPRIKSLDILNQVLSQLKRTNPGLAARYNLKKALSKLGPTGYAFEKYIAALLKEYGYRTENNLMIQGFCSSHEIDILAEKDNKKTIVECKYHNQPGITSDLKVALYTHARFLDIKKQKHSNRYDKMMLATNTRCTWEAIKYAKCVGLEILSWHYPKNKGLETLIDQKKLYPLTILMSANKRFFSEMSRINIVLAVNLLKYSAKALSLRTKLKEKEIIKAQKEAEMICSF